MNSWFDQDKSFLIKNFYKRLISEEIIFGKQDNNLQ